MVGEWKQAGVSERLGTYVGELREFFASRHLPSGRPEDVVGFAEAVTQGGPLAEEVGSLVRSIMLREDEALGRGELLELVALAVGGPGAENASPAVQAGVRKIFVFLNEALRQGHTFPETLPDEDEDGPDSNAEMAVTAGHILAARTPQDAPRTAPEPRNSPESRELASAPPRGTQPLPPAREAMLLRAVRMAEADAVEFGVKGEGRQASMAQGWLVPALAAGLAVIGIGVYVTRPTGTHKGAGTAFVTQGQPGLAPPSACVAPLQAGVSRAALDERMHWARNLMDQKLYDAALPELRDIARVNPGLPGIQLQVSEALMNLKRPDEAREAIDTQIGISECLAKLPSASLDGYCAQQFAGSSGGGCREQLGHIREAAQLQAALVHLELGHRMAPEAAAAAATAPDLPHEAPATHRSISEPDATAVTAATAGATLRVHRAAPLPPASEGDTASAPRKAAVTRPATEKKPAGDDALRRGEGTDSSFGAYQKPE